ncbi:uncharacterized protein J5F26_002744 isoform 1-T1 [Ciconia maguari]
MVASQRGGRISYRFPSPHPKGIAGPSKSPAERAACSLRRAQPPLPPTGSLSPKTPNSNNQSRSIPPGRQHSSAPQVRRSIQGSFRKVEKGAGAPLALAEALSASATAATCSLRQDTLLVERCSAVFSLDWVITLRLEQPFLIWVPPES